VAAIAALALLGWQGVTTVGRTGPVDSGEHMAYAAYLDEHHAIPDKAENYEYATPPLFHVLGVAAEHAVGSLPARQLGFRSNLLTRAAWLVLVVAAAAALTSRRGAVRAAGLAGLAAAVLWGANQLVAAARSLPWAAGQFLALAALAGFAAVTALLALELWPGNRRRALAAAAVLLAYPVVFRMGVLFHPELAFAFMVALALLLFLRGQRGGWSPALGASTGAVCAAAALTRQSAALVIVCLLLATVVAGGRRAGPFLAAYLAAIVLVAGPWWAYAYDRWDNPIQSNLAPRESLMLDRQPGSFYVSFPARSLVLHPYRPDFDNELLPKLHADLWSDWFGAFHGLWYEQSRLDRATASSQSVLGFAGDGLAIAGLALVGVPAALRVARRRGRDQFDVPPGLLALVTVAAVAGFVLMLIRFPQIEGDPIKSSYLLFTAPCWAIFTVAAWGWVKQRSRAAHILLSVVAGLYVLSYAASLVSVFT
jgi:4-amino-4-deoxy-L-arabinose transferase-like glycosyltransferase